MQKYLDLIIGLISGIALTFLNNDIVHESIISIFTIFNQVNDSKISLFLVVWSSRLIIFLSFIGIIITITYSLVILKAILIRKQS
jgi:hypothetical protein